MNSYTYTYVCTQGPFKCKIMENFKEKELQTKNTKQFQINFKYEGNTTNVNLK